jgi:SAM-dependent methyltransferase
MPVCCICEHTVSHWLPHPHAAQRSPFMTLMETVGSDLSVYGCPHCHANDRDRHLWLYMNAADIPAQIAGASVLHLAPEAALEPLIARCGPARYVRGDLYPTQPRYQKLDAEALPFGDAEFDLVIANHLLEHVNRPAQALAEFARCLKPGGMLIAQTPYAPYLTQTMELNVPVPPAFAKLYFGQEDHVRLFGANIASHFEAAGLQGQLWPHEGLLQGFDAQEYGCNAREPFFAFCKPLPAPQPALSERAETCA